MHQRILSAIHGHVRVVCLALAAGAFFHQPAMAQTTPAPLCNGGMFWTFWCGSDSSCVTPANPTGQATMQQGFWCGTGEPAMNPAPVSPGMWGCQSYGTCMDPAPPDTTCPGPVGKSSDQCVGLDDDSNGCIDENCTIGRLNCTCTAHCDTHTCPPQQAKCNPSKSDQPETCGDGIDNNCNGIVDEACTPKTDCNGNAGFDPILLVTRSAATTPFTDFSVQALSRLSITRTYNSADVSVVLGTTPGVFGRGWHHDWEASLSCQAGACIVSRGLETGLMFKSAGTALSLDGSETWSLYTGYSDQALHTDNQSVLAKRSNGTWILFSTDGTEQHFQTVCDACQPGDLSTPRCMDAEAGGRARLVKVVDPAGNAVAVNYDRPSGLLLGLHDDLGHSLELRNLTACASELTAELKYDGATVATYAYQGLDLQSAVDADGNPLRSYVYYPNSGGRLWAVQNEAGANIAQFQYDGWWRATGIIDSQSSVSVNYDAPEGIAATEYFRGPDGDTSVASVRQFDQDGKVTSISDGCACGPARTQQWTDRRLTCSADALGHAAFQEFDPQGRLTHRLEYSGTSCTPPSPPPVDSKEEWRAYGVVKPIAQGFDLALDLVTEITRRSTVSYVRYAKESYDYSQAPDPADPPGYSCTAAPLPTGSVLCRQISSGYGNANSTLVQRHATFFSYDARGRLVRTYGPVDLDAPSATDVPPLEERTYWADTETLPRRGRLHEVKRYPSPTGTPLVTSYDYDAFGPFQITDASGGITTIVKDGRGRPAHVIAADGKARETRYYDGLSPRVQVLPSGAALRSSYDANGRLATVERLSSDPDAPNATPVLGWSEVYQYDAAGNRIHFERRDATGTVKWQQDSAFDVQHRVVKDTNPAAPGAARSWTFDTSGFLVGMADEEGRGTIYTPDTLNRPTKVRKTGLDSQNLPVGLDVANYVYGQRADTLSSVTDGNGNATTYLYDDFGRIESLASPSLRQPPNINFANDARGNVLQRSDQASTVQYTYDGLDRVLTVSAHGWGGASVAYTYVYDEPGGAGRLSTVVEPDRTVHFGYDPVGRLTSETIQENGVATPLVTTYAYDTDGALWQVTYPSGLRIQYDRDLATGEVMRVVNLDTGTKYADQVAHYPQGPVKSLAFGNGQPLSQSFNLRYEPLSISSGPLSLAYTVSPSGDVTQIADTSQTLASCNRNTHRDFGYDFLDRLTDSPGWLSYGYDSAGNRTSDAVEGAGASYAYAYDRVIRKDVGGKPKLAFEYDFQTNLSGVGEYDASGTSVTQGVCLRHDPLGRMTLFGWTNAWGIYPDNIGCLYDSNVVTPVARFKYDARGRRIARQDAATGQWKYMVSDPAGNPLSELALVNGTWTRVRDYVWLDDRPLAQVEYPGPTPQGEGYAYYFHVDHIGLPRAMTNAAGQLVWNTFPRPYGDIAEKTMTDPLSGRVVVTNLRLPGQYDERLLSSLGLQGPYYNWNRWYLPGVGRYMELDPIALDGGLNSEFRPDWFSYVEGNPLRFVDPEGLKGGDHPSEGMCIALGNNPLMCQPSPYQGPIELMSCAQECAFVSTLICAGTRLAASEFLTPAGGMAFSVGCRIAKVYVCRRICKPKNPCPPAK